MRNLNKKGFTLLELLVASGIFALIAAGTTALLTSSLNAQGEGNDRYQIYREGLLIMERMTNQVAQCTFLLIPNAHKPTRDILAISGFTNEDGDNYFDDPLFPRIDEDPKKQMTDDNTAGIAGVDDDGDGVTDEGDRNDDDEDGSVDEDPFDGVDNDGDGNIDEDTGDDANIPGMDDDGDGSIDEGDIKDDDEDGTINEDQAGPTIYSMQSGTSTLQVSEPSKGVTTVLSTRVSHFELKYEKPNLILIELSLKDNEGEEVAFSEYVFVRNAYQRVGKRVR
jgi:prepilin-type N-terminal cleavage/methylation domain-containing protein